MKKRWLLDHNLPKQLSPFLEKVGIQCNWTSSEGWETLANGELVRVAIAAGYACLLTNDRKFANSAGNALAKNAGFAVIEITLEQAPKREFMKSFETAWNDKRISPVPSRVVRWPNG